MKYDLIISNPPYGSPGNTITKNIIENVDYDCFVNLLPCNDYRRYNKSFKLYQFVDLNTIRPIMKGFKDAAVTTTLCMVMKERQYSRTQSEFEIENYQNEKLKKYFYENNSRPATYTYSTNTPVEKIKELDIKKTIILGARDVNHKHLPYSKECVQYKWNIEESVDAAWVEENYACKSFGKDGQTSLFVIYLNSEKEKQNMLKILYSDFMEELWKALNVDSYCKPDKFMPKVDWSRPWTPEQVLREYGYSEDEIRAALDDYLSEDEFEIENYIDESLKKYFYENVKRKHYAIDNFIYEPTFAQFNNAEVETSIYIGHRDPKSNHLPYSQKSITTRYNKNQITKQQVIDESSKSIQALGKAGDFYIISFDTEIEKTNMAEFMYSSNGFRFISKIFTALNADSSIPLNKFMPKVNWEKPQTVESILLDYNYTPAEIAEILDDLKNYRYMDEAK